MAPIGGKEIIAAFQLLTAGGILYFAGKKLVKESLKLRADTISKKIVDAKIELERLQFESQKARQEINQMSATKEKLVAEVREQGQRLYDQLVAEAKDTASRILADSKLAAENEVQQAAQRLKQKVVDQAVQTALKMAESSENKSVLHRGLVDQFGDIQNGVA